MSQFVLTFHFYLFLKTTTLNILLHATVSAMDYTPNVVSKRCFSLYLSIPGLRKGPGKFLMGVLESPGKVLDFFQGKSGSPLIISCILRVTRSDVIMDSNVLFYLLTNLSADYLNLAV